jgi:hypothetical protein
MNTDVATLIFVILSFGLIMVRFDRPAKRLDAIYAQIMRGLVQDPLRKEEILNEWIASQTEAAKDTRRFWPEHRMGRSDERCAKPGSSRTPTRPSGCNAISRAASTRRRPALRSAFSKVSTRC